MQRYKDAPFAGQFDPFGKRYQDVYVPVAQEAARRLGEIPSAAQAGGWGNWRNKYYNIPMDIADNLLQDVQGVNYNPSQFETILKKLGGPVK
jgi:hypothetical protein